MESSKGFLDRASKLVKNRLVFSLSKDVSIPPKPS